MSSCISSLTAIHLSSLGAGKERPLASLSALSTANHICKWKTARVMVFHFSVQDYQQTLIVMSRTAYYEGSLPSFWRKQSALPCCESPRALRLEASICHTTSQQFFLSLSRSRRILGFWSCTPKWRSLACLQQFHHSLTFPQQINKSLWCYIEVHTVHI